MVHGFKFRPQVPKSGVTYWRYITFDGLVRIIPPKRSAVPLFGRHAWWAIYWAIHSHIAWSGTRLQIPATGPQIWGHLLTKYHIWRISEDYPAKTKRCTTFWTTCRGELYIELSIAIQPTVVHGFKFRPQVPKSGVNLLTKYHIWRISEDYPPKTKRCTTFWTTCRGELYIELSIAI